VIVVKVGGSLYTRQLLGPALRRWLSGQNATVLLVPGGGVFADAVRILQPVHALNDATCHRLALHALATARWLLQELVGSTYQVADCWELFGSDQALPHSWAITSDTLALLLTQRLHAEKLVLLKSLTIPAGTPWQQASACGWVDDEFPRTLEKHPVPVEAINFLELIHP